MQSKMLKKILLFLSMLCLLFCTININFVQSYAKVKNVTNSISAQDKKNIKKLTKCFSTPCGYDLTERGMVEGQTTGYNFSNISARRHILNLSFDEIYVRRVNGNELSKRLFGVSTSNIDLLMGQWGCAWPIIKVKYIYKISSRKYKIKSNLVWHDGDQNTNTKIGEVIFSLKKKSNTYYGYIVKSLKITKTSKFLEK